MFKNIYLEEHLRTLMRSILSPFLKKKKKKDKSNMKIRQKSKEDKNQCCVFNKKRIIRFLSIGEGKLKKCSNLLVVFYKTSTLISIAIPQVDNEEARTDPDQNSRQEKERLDKVSLL